MDDLSRWLQAALPAAPGIGAKRRAAIEARLGPEPRRRDALLALPSQILDLRPAAPGSLQPGREVAFWFEPTAPARRLARNGLAINGTAGPTPVSLIWFRRPPRAFVDRIGAGPALLSGRLQAAPDGCLTCPHPRLHRPADAGSLRARYGGFDAATSRHVQALIGSLLAAWPQAAGTEPLRDALAVLHGLVDGDPTAARRHLARLEWLAFRRELAAAQARPFAARPIAAPQRLARALEARLPFAPSPSQHRVVAEIRRDLAATRASARVVNGDVGSGKTLVAALAIADVVEAGRQALLLAPSESLALQHARTLDDWLRPLGVEVGFLSGSLPAAARRCLRERLRDGSVDVVAGTHALLEAPVVFKDLALAVIDEQHRYGVRQRGMLAAKGAGVHVLALTATPIPRTLALMLDGALAVSRLDAPMRRAGNVATAAIGYDRIEAVIERLCQAIAGGSRAFWVCPSIEPSAGSPGVVARAREFSTLLPDRVACVTGRQDVAKREQQLDGFRSGERPLLVATTVVEVGIDVPDATILVVEAAERFGLAQLHQLRGRVGRAGQQASCVLLHGDVLAANQRHRLDLLRRCNDGLALAEADLETRGGGAPLGLEQRGDQAFRFVDPVRDAAWLVDAPATASDEALAATMFPLQPTVTGGLAGG